MRPLLNMDIPLQPSPQPLDGYQGHVSGMSIEPMRSVRVSAPHGRRALAFPPSELASIIYIYIFCIEGSILIPCYMLNV